MPCSLHAPIPKCSQSVFSWPGILLTPDFSAPTASSLPLWTVTASAFDQPPPLAIIRRCTLLDGSDTPRHGPAGFEAPSAMRQERFQRSTEEEGGGTPTQELGTCPFCVLATRGEVKQPFPSVCSFLQVGIIFICKFSPATTSGSPVFGKE